MSMDVDSATMDSEEIEDQEEDEEEEPDDFAMADYPNSPFNPLTTTAEQPHPRNAIDNAASFAPNFVFRVHCESGGGSASIQGTRKVYCKGTYMASEQHGVDCIYRRTWDALIDDFSRHLKWAKPEGYHSPFISWSTSLHMVLYRAFTGWYNIEDKDMFLCFLDLRKCTLINGNVLGVTDDILNIFCDFNKEQIKEFKEENKFTTEVLTYGSFSCQGALTMVNWAKVKPLLMELYPWLTKLPRGLAAGMNQKAQAQREKWSKEAGRYITPDELQLAIKIAQLFRVCVDNRPELHKTDPNLVLALLGCMGNVFLPEDGISIKKILELFPREADERRPYPGQRNKDGKIWGDCCHEILRFQKMSDQVRPETRAL